MENNYSHLLQDIECLQEKGSLSKETAEIAKRCLRNLIAKANSKSPFTAGSELVLKDLTCMDDIEKIAFFKNMQSLNIVNYLKHTSSAA